MEEQVKSKVVAVALVSVIALGAGIWAYLEFSADLLVDRNAGMQFAAEFEKRCQGAFEPNYCLRFAGMHHSSCFRESTRAGDGGAVYDRDAYFECMQRAEETYEP